MSTFLTAAALAVLTTAGLVAAVVSDGAGSLAWAVGTVAVAGLLAWRLRARAPGAVLPATLATAILIVSAGLPATIVLTEGRGPSPAAVRAAAFDPSTELRNLLAKADEAMPSGSDAIASIDIDGNTSQARLLDLRTGEQVYIYYSRSSGTWYGPSRSSSTQRGDALFRRADLARLDLTAATRKVEDAARGLGVDLSKRSSADGVSIARRSPDRLLVASFDLSSRVTFETDGAGNLPDNLALATVDGLLPAAQRLLRAHGLDPAAPVLAELEYRVFTPSGSAYSVGSGDPGTLELRVAGGGKSGTLTETVGRFPQAALTSSPTATGYFALTAVTAAGIEKARADVERRFGVPPIDAHAISLSFDRDTTSPGWMRGDLPPLLELGLGPRSEDRAYFHPDGTFAAAR